MSSMSAITSTNTQKSVKAPYKEASSEPESSEPETSSEAPNSSEGGQEEEDEEEENEEDAEGESEEESDGGACWNCKLKDVRCVWAK